MYTFCVYIFACHGPKSLCKNSQQQRFVLPCTIFEIAAGQRRREPVTTAADINNYLQKVKKVDGINKARQAAKYILDRSNSPRESILAVLMNLPISRGGYRLLEPNLNYDVNLSDAGVKLFGRPSCCCDFVWPEQNVVAEYDSNSMRLG